MSTHVQGQTTYQRAEQAAQIAAETAEAQLPGRGDVTVTSQARGAGKVWHFWPVSANGNGLASIRD